MKALGDVARVPSPRYLDDGGDHVVRLLVRRLVARGALNLTVYINLTAAKVRRFQPTVGYTQEVDRPSVGQAGWEEWHYGRVRFFMDELAAGRKVDPIEIDNRVSGGYILPAPVIVDGYHRLVAHKLAGIRTVPALYGGRVDLLEYLKGERRRCPK